MAATLFPLQGYPFTLDVADRLPPRRHRADASRPPPPTSATSPAPTAAGSTPTCPPAAASSTTAPCNCDAATRILTDPDRQLPTGTEPVAGTPFDFRTGRRLGDLHIDYAFTDLRPRRRRAAPGSG